MKPTSMRSRIASRPSGLVRLLMVGCIGLAIWQPHRGLAQELNPPPPATSAAELSLEQLVNIRVDSVIGASRYEQKVTQAPSSVSIVTADEIKKFGYRTLADVLRSVRGLYVTYDRSYYHLGARGFNRAGDFNTRFLFLIDGHRINDNVYDLAD